MIVQPRDLYTTNNFVPTTPTYSWEPQPRLASDDIVPRGIRYPDVLEQRFVFQPSELTQDPSATDPVFIAYREALDRFYENHNQPSIRIDQLTGLPTLIYGILQQVEDGQAIEAAAEQFLKENQLVVSGVPDDGTNKAGSEVVLEPRIRSSWQDGAEHLLYGQLNRNNIPIFGSHIALTYQAQVLTLITATLQPMPAEALDQLEWDENKAKVWWDNWGELKTFPEEVNWIQFLPPPELNPAAQHSTLEIDRCIFPYIPYYTHENNTNLKLAFTPEAEEGGHVEDAYWYLPGADFFEAFAGDQIIRSAGGGIYRPAWRVVAADKAGNHWLTIIDAETAQVLWLYALDFHAGSVAIAPQNAAHFAAVGGALEAGIIAAQEGFVQWLGLSSYSTTATFYPIEHVQVILNPNETTRYRWQDHAIYIGGATGGQWPLNEPGADPEVAFHEFTHAMTHFLRTQIIEVTNPKQFAQTQGLNEGFGFFLACAHSDDRNYGETAHAAWIRQPSGEPWLDLEAPPFQRQASFQMSPSPFAGAHKRGLWWAKVWWALRLEPQLGLTLARELVLQALQLATPINHTSLFADIMCTVAQNRSDMPEDVVLAILQNREAYS